MTPQTRKNANNSNHADGFGEGPVSSRSGFKSPDGEIGHSASADPGATF